MIKLWQGTDVCGDLHLYETEAGLVYPFSDDGSDLGVNTIVRVAGSLEKAHCYTAYDAKNAKRVMRRKKTLMGIVEDGVFQPAN